MRGFERELERCSEIESEGNGRRNELPTSRMLVPVNSVTLGDTTLLIMSMDCLQKLNFLS